MPRTNYPPVYENVRFALAARRLSSLEQREEYLRRRLRRSPRWRDGHLKLAELLARAALKHPEIADPRLLSGVRLAAYSVKTLLNKDPAAMPSRGADRGREEQEADLWLACAEFLNKRYEAALTRFEAVLEEKNVVQLSRNHHYLALEYAAASASVLGREREARNFIEQIPEGSRNSDVRTMSRALQASAELGGARNIQSESKRSE